MVFAVHWHESAMGVHVRGLRFDPWSGKIPHIAGQLSPRALGPVSHNYWNLGAWSPCFTAKEGPTVRSARTTREQPLLTAPGESPRAAAKTQHSWVIKKTFLNNWKHHAHQFLEIALKVDPALAPLTRAGACLRALESVVSFREGLQHSELRKAA